MTMYAENQLTTLRKKYNKTLWTYIGVSVLSMTAAFLLLYGQATASATPLRWLILAGVGLVLAAIEYAVERTLYKKGVKAAMLPAGFILAILLLFVILSNVGLAGYMYMAFPVCLGFLFNRPLIPAIGLLADYRRLSDGTPRETVGRIKANTRRYRAAAGRDFHLLFEDELTGEVHLLLAGSMDPTQRYRVLYLPHSGLAVGEAIPDNVTFDPFGNPIEREASESTVEKPAYTEPDDAAANTENPYSAANPTSEELNPNSPARQKAAKFSLAGKICKALGGVGFGLTFVGALTLQDTPGSILIFPAVLFIFGGFLLGDYFQKQDRKLRCTRRTTARCIDTVRRKSGKHSRRYPIVGYEVDGVSYTAELSVSCSRSAVGELYTICYDPLDPKSVRIA